MTFESAREISVVVQMLACVAMTRLLARHDRGPHRAAAPGAVLRTSDAHPGRNARGFPLSLFGGGRFMCAVRTVGVLVLSPVLSVVGVLVFSAMGVPVLSVVGVPVFSAMGVLAFASAMGVPVILPAIPFSVISTADVLILSLTCGNACYALSCHRILSEAG